MSNAIKKHQVTTEFEGTITNDADIECSTNKNVKATEEQFRLNVVNPTEVKPDQVIKIKVDRPKYLTHDDWVNAGGSDLSPGLYFHGLDKDNNAFDTWICTPIYTVAQTCNEQGTAWGLLLKFMNPDGKWTEWAMPSYMLRGSGEEIRGELLNMGVKISPDGNKLLNRWLANQAPSQRLTAVHKTGWSRGKNGVSFVFPNRILGANDVRFQTDHLIHNDFSQKGSAEEWKQEIALLCVDNPILSLAVSTAFAGPLLKLVKHQENGGGGVHLTGDSSRGKTTALQIASSVWGPPEFLRTWRATANGLESVAAARNDTLLALDECGESDPKEIGTIIYALGNGLGKQRANKNGGMRQSAHWRVMVLSSGEASISTHMLEGNKRTRAGQSVRLLDIPATDYQHGAFNNLHGRSDGRFFSDELKQKTNQYYGSVGIKFVQCLINDEFDLSEQFAKIRQHPSLDS